MDKVVHILNETPDVLGVARSALCGQHSPPYLAIVTRLDLDQKGIRRPMLEEGDDPNAIMPGFRVCARCLKNFQLRTRRSGQ